MEKTDQWDEVYKVSFPESTHLKHSRHSQFNIFNGNSQQLS